MHIELTAPCLDYLRSAPSMPLPRPGVKGVTRLGDRKSYRVKYRDEEMGKRRQKTFSASVHGVDSVCDFAVVFRQSRMDNRDALREQEAIIVVVDD